MKFTNKRFFILATILKFSRCTLSYTDWEPFSTTEIFPSNESVSTNDTYVGSDTTDSLSAIPPPLPSALPPGSFDYYYYYYEYGEGTVLNSTDVDSYLTQPETKKYLDGFSNDVQKMIVLDTLRNCPYIQLCNFSLGVGLPVNTEVHADSCCAQCLCTPECVEYGICCPDYPGFKLDTVSAIPEQEVVETCMMTSIGYQSSTATSTHVKAFQNCPASSDKRLHVRCSGDYRLFSNITFDDIIPVTDNVTLKKYRNIHCATCNGAHKDMLTPWNVALNCLRRPTNSFATELISSVISGTVQCQLQLQPPRYPPVEVCSTVISECNVTGLWKEFDLQLSRACAGYGLLFIVKHNSSEIMFQNIHCSLCNGFATSFYLCSWAHQTPGSLFSFSGLLRLDSLEIDGQRPVTERCGPDSMFDDVQKRCRDVSCSYHRFFTANTCDLLIESTEKIVYRVTSYVRPSTQLDLLEVYKHMPLLRLQIEDFLNKSMPVDVCSRRAMILLQNATIGNDVNLMVDRIYFRYDVFPYDMHIIDDVVNSLMRIEGLNISLNTSEGKEITFTFYLKDEIRYQNIDIQFEKYMNWTFWRSMPVSLPELMSLAVIQNDTSMIPYFNWNEDYDYCFDLGIMQRLLTLRSCPMFSINMNDYGMIETERGIIYKGHEDIVLNLSEYIYDDIKPDVIKICVDKYRRVFFTVPNHIDNTGFTAELIVSIVSVSISILCLVVSLFTYLQLPQLQTLPGKNNMGLITSLLLAQSMYLLSSYGRLDTDSLACKLVGGFTHFFWLLSIFWMNVCTFHMFRVLMKIRVNSRSSIKKHFHYHVYCIILAVLFVSLNILITMVTSEYTDVGYGTKRCYISSQRMIEVTFGIPATIVILANLSMFVATIIKIKRAPSVRINVNHERNNVIVFAKLSTITGATWLFGFVYMWTDVAVFSYIFIILNGSQGLFMMVSFICNARTLAMFKNKSQSVMTTRLGQTNPSPPTQQPQSMF